MTALPRNPLAASLFPAALLAGLLAVPPVSRGTETENLGLRALAAPGPVAADGKTGDWNLAGGVFVCGDVESLTAAASTAWTTAGASATTSRPGSGCGRTPTTSWEFTARTGPVRPRPA